MTKITSLSPPGYTRGDNPGHSPTMHDHLPGPNGKKVGQTSSEELYRFFDKLKIEGFNHSLGRQFAVEKYAAHIAKVANLGADAAVADFIRKAG